MKRDERHYTEEELLLHLLGEDVPEHSDEMARHLQHCSECAAVFNEYGVVREEIQKWPVPEPPEAWWRDNQARLLQRFREDGQWLRRSGLFGTLSRFFRPVWDYALENPLPTMGYVAAALAFASERTITVFRLDHLLPKTNEMLEILRQVF
jgi:hypothetical protein